jgi:hypothetical protein
MLPTLLPGANTITVEGEGPAPGTALRIEYAWEEDGKPKTRTETAEKLPHAFEIRVEEKDPRKVRCLHQTLTVVGR